MSKSRIKKVAHLGIKRETNHIYFLRGCEVWRLPFKTANATNRLLDRPNPQPELIARTQFERQPGYLYFLDQFGDIACAKRSTTPKRRKRTTLD